MFFLMCEQLLGNDVETYAGYDVDALFDDPQCLQDAHLVDLDDGIVLLCG